MKLHRSTWPDLVRLGWPVSATLLVRVTMRTVDLIVVGLVVGAAGVAAIGIGDAAARIVLMTSLGLGAGTIATVSQNVGAGRHDEANAATTQSALLAVAMGIPFGLAGYAVAPWFFRILGAEPDVVDLGVLYLRVVILTAPFRMLAIMLTRAFQGAGDTRTPMVVRILGTGVNISLTVALVAGLGPLPQLGVLGAAIGTAVGNVTSAALLVAILARGQHIVGFARAGLWAPEVVRRIVTIGWPQVVERNLYAFAAIPLNAIVLTFGTAANAGFQIGRRVQLYALLPARGVGTAASAYMGNLVGALDPDTGETYGRGGYALTVAISLAIAVPVFVFARPLASAFVRETAALDLATTWVRVYAIATIFRAAYGTLRSAMQGAGETRAPLAASAFGLAVFALGFSWLVGIQLGVGLVGVFVGVVLDPVVRTVLLYRWFDAGRWRRALPDEARAAAGVGV